MRAAPAPAILLLNLLGAAAFSSLEYHRRLAHQTVTTCASHLQHPTTTTHEPPRPASGWRAAGAAPPSSSTLSHNHARHAIPAAPSSPSSTFSRQQSSTPQPYIMLARDDPDPFAWLLAPPLSPAPPRHRLPFAPSHHADPAPCSPISTSSRQQLSPLLPYNMRARGATILFARSPASPPSQSPPPHPHLEPPALSPSLDAPSPPLSPPSSTSSRQQLHPLVQCNGQSVASFSILDA